MSERECRQATGEAEMIDGSIRLETTWIYMRCCLLVCSLVQTRLETG